jgi:hypothetical protein
MLTYNELCLFVCSERQCFRFYLFPTCIISSGMWFVVAYVSFERVMVTADGDLPLCGL